MSLALQAERLGLVTHAMGGIHPERAYELAGVSPEEYESLCAIVVGKRDTPELLPDDLRARETPSLRRPASEFAWHGAFRPEE